MTEAGEPLNAGKIAELSGIDRKEVDKAMKALQEFLRPEFINRVDEIICFNRLSEADFAGSDYRVYR